MARGTRSRKVTFDRYVGVTVGEYCPGRDRVVGLPQVVRMLHYWITSTLSRFSCGVEMR